MPRLYHFIVLLFFVCECPAAVGANDSPVFPIGGKIEDGNWESIGIEEAIKLIEKAISKEAKYGTSRAKVLIYQADQLQIKRDALMEIFAGIKNLDDPSTLRKSTAPLVSHMKDFTQKWNWSETTIVEDGDSVIERCESEITPSTYLISPKIKTIYEGIIKQVDVALPGTQNIIHVNRLSSLKIYARLPEAKFIRSAARRSDLIKIDCGNIGDVSQTSIISLSDANVRYQRTNSEDGRVLTETWQGPTAAFDGAVGFPTSFLTLKYNAGALKSVCAVAIRHAEFNVRIAPSEFDVAIPAGTVVVDSRSGELAVARVDENIADLVKALNEGHLRSHVRKATVTPISATASSWHRSILILINVLIVGILLVVVRWRRVTASPS